MQDPPVPRVQIPEFRALVPAVVGRDPIPHDSEQLSFHRKQTDGLASNRREGECGCGEFGRVQSDEIHDSLMKKLIEVRLGGANHQADVRVQGPCCQGGAEVCPIVGSGEQDRTAGTNAGFFESRIAPTVTDREPVQQPWHSFYVRVFRVDLAKTEYRYAKFFQQNSAVLSQASHSANQDGVTRGCSGLVHQATEFFRTAVMTSSIFSSSRFNFRAKP